MIPGRIRRSLVSGILILACLVAAAQGRVTISGYVRSDRAGEGIPGASVLLGKTAGTYSRSDGYFTLSVPAGKYLLRCSCIGYECRQMQVDLTRDKVVTIILKEGLDMEEAVVSASSGSDVDRTTMGVLTISPQLLTQVPMVMGEPDVLKTIQLFPGIQQGMEGSSGLYVRGGGPDENLFLLDGVPVYNVSHLLGMFSSFTPEAVKNVEVYKEAFPARYGGRLSGVVDIATNDGATDRLHGTASLGLLSSRAHLEGPLGHKGTTFSVSGRMMHTILAAPFKTQIDSKYWYQFYDVNAKLVQNFNNGDRLYFTFYTGRDDFDYASDEQLSDDFKEISSNSIDMHWGNIVGAAGWVHRFNGRLSSHLIASFNQYQMRSFNATDKRDRTGNKWNYESTYNSGMRDYRAEYSFKYEPSAHHLIQFGVLGVYHQCMPETQFKSSGNGKDPIVVKNGGNTLNGGEMSVYVEDDMRYGIVSLNPGLRYTLMTTDGKSYHSVEPRLSAKFQIWRGISLKASYSRMSQYMHLLTTSTLALPTDLWVPITKDFSPMYSNQYAVGAYYNHGNGIEASIEGYYKDMQNVLEYKDGVSFFGNPAGWEYQVESGRGRSYGMEILLRKKQGRLTGWLGYTLSWSERCFSTMNVNGGNWFPYKYDRRHNLVVSARYSFNRNWALSGLWSFASGNMLSLQEREILTYVTGKHSEPIPWADSYVPHRNNYRLPPTHHLDISADWKHRIKSCSGVLSFGVYNAYNSLNPNIVFITTSYETVQSPDTDRLAVRRGTKLTYLPILPYFSYTFNF